MALEAFDRYKSFKETDCHPAIMIASIQEAIGHSAALSRYFWPSGLGPKNIREFKKARAKKLLEAFKLSGDSPLKNRKLRDAWEHFDERLDVFLISYDAGMYYPQPIIGSHELADDPVSKVF